VDGTVTYYRSTDQQAASQLDAATKGQKSTPPHDPGIEFYSQNPNLRNFQDSTEPGQFYKPIKDYDTDSKYCFEPIY